MNNRSMKIQNRSKKILNIITITSIICSSMLILPTIFIEISEAADNKVEWSILINIKPDEGTNDTLVFGEAYDASDNIDKYDMPKPPAPQTPYLRAWFNTNLNPPHNLLWEEYKEYPNDHNVWNFTVMWAPENDSSTSVTISWDKSIVIDNEYSSTHLYRNDDLVADMITENSYTYSHTANTPYSFQVLCQSEIPSNESANQTNLTIPIIIGLIVIIIIIALLFWRKK